MKKKKKTKKIKKICWNCEKVFYVVPSQSSRKFCPNSNCYEEYRITPAYNKYLRDKLLLVDKKLRIKC